MSETDESLMVRVAWLYYVGGYNQEVTAAKLGLTRARVNKILGEARESGLVSISIDHQNAGTLPAENELTQRYGLDFCISTPHSALMYKMNQLLRSANKYHSERWASQPQHI